MKHKSRAEKDRRYAASAKGQARRRRYERSAKGKVRARRWRKSSKGRRAIHRYNVSPKGQAKRESSLAKARATQRRTTAVPVPEAHRLNTAPVPAKRDPAPPHAKPERGMREEIMRRTAAVYGGGANRGDVAGSRSAPGTPEELIERHRRQLR